MGMDIDYIVAESAIEHILEIVRKQNHGERAKIARDIEKFLEKIERKYNKEKK